MQSLTQIPLGTQVIIGEAAARRRRIERQVRNIFEGWSYQEIIPPIFDYMEVFERGVGGELREKIYRFIDREGNILALRPEFTSLVAKTVAGRMKEAPKPIRLYYSGDVLRYEPPRGGQQREFSQIGVEHVGGDPLAADAEVLFIVIEALESLGVNDFQINLGHMDYFGGIVERLGLPDEVLARLRELIDVKDKLALTAEIDRLALPERCKRILLTIPDLIGGEAVVRQARALVTNERSLRALRHLHQLFLLLKKFRRVRHITLDLSEVRGLDYYTGIIFKVFVRGLGFEVGSGGRYDHLLEHFGVRSGAVGFSFSIERLLLVTPEKYSSAKSVRASEPKKILLRNHDYTHAFAEGLRCRKKNASIQLLTGSRGRGS